MPPAARLWNSFWGSETQLKIWMGSTVKMSNGPLGSKAT